ncbi:hypothetical protein Tco_0020775, partial [Tanacetum coccineum]
DFETRLTKIYRREVHRVHVFDFGGLLDLMAEGLSGRMLMEHRDAQGVGISSAGDFLGTVTSYTAIRDPILRLCDRLISCSIAGRSQAPKKVTVTDLFYLRGVDVGSVNVPYLLARGLTVIAPELSIIDMDRQPDVAAGALGVAQDAPIVDEGGQADPTLEDVHEMRGALTEQREVIDAMARDFSKFSTWVVTGLARMMDRAGVAYMPSETHVPYQRHRVGQRTGEASTSAAQHDPQQPDP